MIKVMVLKVVVLILIIVAGYLIATNDEPYDPNDDSWI
jgi:hypothetical protein